ncbi:uncharacterized protein LOC126188113 isoform X1 [Schistocerca cancellata]|uniref:uncharacterized protein LOC126188113 isoform X1 n=2 Tax=Schistocerca cancellata TaxID=274614 RepID=UPI002118946F|nr:uncharacterized protein LOC126188113 isoform X1 [Schistocerca cancellata]XP_049785538.1 uncharacterized protein LOC126188113 isoform X1 [Schistocerca cancellata]XP_049785539.1 uncharacterized protein LOC126188113 isoform X1 [Schistocerca cancellata]XP_049785540.1 uncharacterized protein LOC126188113 isoform X1 [Schistocerca cancellata]
MCIKMQTGERTAKDKRLQNSNIRPKGTYCAALWCNNNFGSNPSLSLFRIPREKSRAAQWLANAGREDLLERGPKAWHVKYLCEQHFTDRMFMNEKRKKLVWNAVPTIFPQPPNTLKKNLASTSGKKDMLNQPSLQAKILRKILPKPVSLSSGEVSVRETFTGSATSTDEEMATVCAVTAAPENANSQLPIETTNNISLVESAETNEIDSFASHLSDVKDFSFEPYGFHFDFNCEESDEKAFPCSSCGEMFLFKNSLIAHETKYHPECYSVTENVSK